MKKNIDFPEDDIKKGIARLERDQKLGKLSDAETLTSIIRGLFRKWAHNKS